MKSKEILKRMLLMFFIMPLKQIEMYYINDIFNDINDQILFVAIPIT